MYESHTDSCITINASSCIHVLHVQKPTNMPQLASLLLQSVGNGVPNRKWWELLEAGTIWKSGRGREVLDNKNKPAKMDSVCISCEVMILELVSIWRGHGFHPILCHRLNEMVPVHSSNRFTRGLTRTLIKGTEKGVPFARLSMQNRLQGRLKLHIWLHHQLDTTVNYPAVYAACSDSHNGNRWERMARCFSNNLASFPLSSNEQHLYSFQ